MPAFTSESLIADYEKILSVWSSRTDLTLEDPDPVNPDDPSKTKKLTYADALKLKEDFENVIKQITDIERQLGTLINSKADLTKIIKGVRTRTLSLFRGVFGPNSTQFERAGGTRQSERATGLTRKRLKGDSMEAPKPS